MSSNVAAILAANGWTEVSSQPTIEQAVLRIQQNPLAVLSALSQSMTNRAMESRVVNLLVECFPLPAPLFESFPKDPKEVHVLEKTGPWFLENRPGGV
jgi:hypothetical protein